MQRRHICGFHNILGGSAGAKFVGHQLHPGIYMTEVVAQTFTKIIQAGDTVWGENESVFRAFTVAGEKIFTFLAVLGQLGGFG